MGDRTGIAWTDATWNPVTGCSKVSRGCKHCYADRVFPRAYAGQTVDCESCNGTGFVPGWYGGARDCDRCHNGQRPRRFTDVMCHQERLDQPLRWRKPRRVFVNSMSDLFHDDVPDAFIAQVFAVMALSRHHTFQVLTKRPERMLELVSSRGFQLMVNSVRPGVSAMFWPLPNVWLGVSVEDQATADQRIPLLLDTPAAVRFVSYEPALGPVDWRWLHSPAPAETLAGYAHPVDWIIVGGESGPGARPFDVQWALDTIEQCRAAGVACFVKQLGAHPVIGPDIELAEWPTAKVLADAHLDKKWEIRLKHRSGADPTEWPEDLQVQEYPE